MAAPVEPAAPAVVQLDDRRHRTSVIIPDTAGDGRPVLRLTVAAAAGDRQLRRTRGAGGTVTWFRWRMELVDLEALAVTGEGALGVEGACPDVELVAFEALALAAGGGSRPAGWDGRGRMRRVVADFELARRRGLDALDAAATVTVLHDLAWEPEWVAGDPDLSATASVAAEALRRGMHPLDAFDDAARVPGPFDDTTVAPLSSSSSDGGADRGGPVEVRRRLAQAVERICHRPAATASQRSVVATGHDAAR